MKAAGMTDMEKRLDKVEGKLTNIEGGYPSKGSSTVRIPSFDNQAVWQLGMERQVDSIDGRPASIESRRPSESSTLRVTCFDNGSTDRVGRIEGRLASIESRYPSESSALRVTCFHKGTTHRINVNFRTPLQKLDDQRGDHM